MDFGFVITYLNRMKQEILSAINSIDPGSGGGSGGGNPTGGAVDTSSLDFQNFLLSQINNYRAGGNTPASGGFINGFYDVKGDWSNSSLTTGLGQKILTTQTTRIRPSTYMPILHHFDEVASSLNGFCLNGSATWPNSATYEHGANDFTIDFWVNPGSATKYYSDVNGSGIGSLIIGCGLNFSCYAQVWWTTDTVNPITLTHQTIMTTSVWHHIALVRNGNTITLYLDGVPSSSTIDATGKTITSSPVATRTVQGTYMDEFRISNIARFTSGFTPSFSEYTTDANTKMLLHFNGMDSSASGARWNTGGSNTATISNSQSKFGNTSVSLSGSQGTNVRVNYTQNTDADLTDFGNLDFTMDFWMYPTSLANAKGIFMFNTGDNSNYFQLGLNTNGALQWTIRDSATNRIDITTGASVIAVNTWSHVALVRNGSNFTIYVNGTSVGTATYSGGLFRYNFNPGIYIGIAQSTYTNGYVGFFDEFRISDIARWTTTFTPAASAYTTDGYTRCLFHFDALNGQINDCFDSSGNAIVSSSVTSLNIRNGLLATNSNWNIFNFSGQTTWTINNTGGIFADLVNKKFGNSSLCLDGHASYLQSTIQSNSDTSLAGIPIGTQNFTLDCWARFNALPGTQTIFTFGTTNLSLVWQVTPTTIRLNISADAATYTSFDSSSITWATGTWYHLVVCRSGNTLYFFKDGVAVGTATFTGSVGTPSGNAYIGADQLGRNKFNGNLDEFAFRVGSAKYTSAFTPPSSAYTDLELYSDIYFKPSTFNSVPTNATLIFELVDSLGDTVTLNTDLVGKVSFDGGTTFYNMSLNYNSDVFNTNNIVSQSKLVKGILASSGKNISSQLVFRLTAANSKRYEINGFVGYWY